MQNKLNNKSLGPEPSLLNDIIENKYRYYQLLRKYVSSVLIKATVCNVYYL